MFGTYCPNSWHCWQVSQSAVTAWICITPFHVVRFIVSPLGSVWCLAARQNKHSTCFFGVAWPETAMQKSAFSWLFRNKIFFSGFLSVKIQGGCAWQIQKNFVHFADWQVLKLAKAYYSRARAGFCRLARQKSEQKKLVCQAKVLDTQMRIAEKANQDPQNQRFSSVKKVSNQLDKNRRKGLQNTKKQGT